MLKEMTEYVARYLRLGLAKSAVESSADGPVVKDDHFYMMFQLKEAPGPPQLTYKDYLDPMIESLLRAIPSNKKLVFREMPDNYPNTGALHHIAKNRGAIVRGTEAFDGVKQVTIFTFDFFCEAQ